MMIKKYIEHNFNNILTDIVKIIKIKTVKGEATPEAPFGENLKYGLEKTLEIAKKLGFKTKNLNNYIGYAEIGEGDEYIAVLGHIDVVPEGDISKWSVNPYSGEIKNNLLIARGAIDNKGPIISSLYSLKAILETNPTFNKRVRIIFGTNEESGDEDIKYYLTQEKPPKYAFTPDGRFPVIFSEKGIYTFSFREKIDWNNTEVLDIEAGTRSNVVPEFGKIILKNSCFSRLTKGIEKLNSISKCKFEFRNTGENIEVNIAGKSAHASSPERGINAILGMYLLLNEVLEEKDSLKNFSNFIAKYIAETTDGKLLGIKSCNEETGDLTISAGITKRIEDFISIKFNIRYPISTTEKILDGTLANKAQENNIIFYKENHNPPLYFPKNSILVKTLQEVYKEITGRDEEPAALGGGTYAKLMPNTVAFGPNYREFKGNPHSFDEYIDLDMLKIGIEIYAKAILRLSEYI